MIRLENFSKSYDKGLSYAVKNLNLEIKDNEVFGLLGHNGAGKSTTIKSIVSIITDIEGKIIINNQELSSHRNEIKKQIGYIPDSPDMFLNITAELYWRLIADAYKISENDMNNRLAELLEIFGMRGNENSFIETFSHGMRQKTFIIGALIAKPSIWILDEPMTGLDPESSFNLKKMIKQHANEGNSVLFSTHVLEVAENLCDRIGILNKGNLIFVGTLNELKEKYSGNSLEEIYINLIKSQDKEV